MSDLLERLRDGDDLSSRHDAADLIEQQQQRIAELENNYEQLADQAQSRYRQPYEREKKRSNELSATVERLRDLLTRAYEQSEEVEELLRASNGRNHELIADQIEEWAKETEKALGQTDEQNLNAVKREAYAEGIEDAVKLIENGEAGTGDLLALSEEYANTKYLSVKDGNK